MTPTSRSSALFAGVFLAVVAVVLAITAATGGPSDSTAAPQRAAAPAQPAAQPAAASDTFTGALPDTSAAFADPALATKEGVLVASGEDVIVERVALTAPISVVVSGQTIMATVVYRVTISAGPYVVRDMPAIASLDGTALGVAMESTDLSALTAFTFDDAVASGGTIAVTYGLPGSTAASWSTALAVAS